MRRCLVVLALLSLSVAGSPVAGAHPVPGFASANVEWLANVPLHADSAGARIVGKRLFVTS